jgi:Flp pilus assembly protein TadG
VRTLNQRRNERGTTIAEFAIVALLFFTIIIGIIEFGRLIYTHNALTDATRAGARFAALHHGATADDEMAVKRYVVYGPHGTFAPDGTPTSPPLIPDLTLDMVHVRFDGVDTDGVAATPPEYGTNLGTATVWIEDYQFNLSIPIIGRRLTLPKYITTAPAESAGNEPADIKP